jgi:hypothetical protein
VQPLFERRVGQFPDGPAYVSVPLHDCPGCLSGEDFDRNNYLWFAIGSAVVTVAIGTLLYKLGT